MKRHFPATFARVKVDRGLFFVFESSEGFETRRCWLTSVFIVDDCPIDHSIPLLSQTRQYHCLTRCQSAILRESSLKRRARSFQTPNDNERAFEKV